jgi:anti-sigma regulatory factor (Ser/Thr protein kinase)
VSGARALRAELAPDLWAPERARALVAPLLDEASEERAWEAATALTELVTNAVIHGWSGADEPIRLRVRSRGGLLRVEVEDPGPGISPEARPLPDASRVSGRGLAIVALLAERWGACRRPSRIWFEMDLGRPGAGLSAPPIGRGTVSLRHAQDARGGADREP